MAESRVDALRAAYDEAVSSMTRHYESGDSLGYAAAKQAADFIRLALYRELRQ